MMKPLVIVPLILCCLNLHLASQTTCASTFTKTIGSALSNESGYSLAVDDTHKVLYVGGSINDSTMLVKVNADGDILWARTFDAIPGTIERIIAVILDSDGMICLAGMTDNSNGGKAFLIKYNPDLQQIIWAKEYLYQGDAYVFGLIEKEPGGNYLMSTNPLDVNDAELLEIDRNTGLINTNFSTHYDLGAAETIWGMVIHDGGLYVTGRYTDGNSASRMRNVLSRMDPANGLPSWTILGHRPVNADARLYGTDLIIDQNAIYSISTGDPNGTNLSISQMYIHKTTLDGEVLWTKHYPIPGTDDVSEEIISTGDGFVIMGRNGGPNDLFLFKIDHDGEVLWARLYNTTGNETTFPTGGTFSQLVSMDGSLYFTAWTEENGRRDMILVKTDSEGRLDDECFVAKPIAISVNDLEEASFYSVDPTVFTFVPEVKTLELSQALTSLQTENTCLKPGNIETTIEAAVCESDTYEGYNQAGTYSDTFNLKSGCDSVRILNLRLVSCDPFIHYDLNACSSYMSNGSNMDYSEFIPSYPPSTICASINATNLFRSPPQENKHSCTPGLNNSSAMCVSSLAGCTWIPGHQASVVMEFSITPEAGATVEVTGLQFYEKGPTTYNWLDGGAGPNNFPTLFGIRILKDGIVIYSNPAIPTTLGWSLHEFNFIDNPLFEVNQTSVFRIELLPYCPVGNGAAVAAWDLEDIVISGGCVILPGQSPVLQGNIFTKNGNPVEGAEIHLSQQSAFTVYNADVIGTSGEYQFENMVTGSPYYARGFHDDNILLGVNTLDLIRMQKHLIGKALFTSLDQYVAADINHDGRINVMDMISLRKTLLGYTPYFPGNTSWRFGVWPQSLQGTDPSLLEETLSIESMQNGTTQADFLGIKIGDLNGTIRGLTNNDPINSDDAISLAIEDVTMVRGVPFTIAVTAMEDIYTEGLQLGWQFNGIALSTIQGIQLSITEENVSFQEDGAFRLSWNSDVPIHLRKGDVLFRLTLIANLDEPLYGNIRQADELLANEIYADQTTSPLKVNIMPLSVSDVSTISFFNVFPNPFTTETTIRYVLAHDGYVRINIYDASGILHYSKETQALSGEHTVQLTEEDFGNYSGMLFCQIICDGDVKVRKVVRQRA